MAVSPLVLAEVNHVARVRFAEQIQKYASLVGRERVIAGADCGFSSCASFAWHKFAALAEGARLASTALW